MVKYYLLKLRERLIIQPCFQIFPQHVEVYPNKTN